MLDALKFAFEIFVVGALALPWVFLVTKSFMASDSPWQFTSYESIVPEAAQKAVAIAFVVAVGYLAGSVISRVSRDLFNDELLGKIPTEDNIRRAMYEDQYCHQNLILMNADLPDENDLISQPTLTSGSPVV